MKKLFLMLAVVGTLAFTACKADEETQKKQEEANKKAAKEAGEIPEFDEQGNEIKKEDKAAVKDPPKTDSTAKKADSASKKQDTKK
jgi:hypothetical protein